MKKIFFLIALFVLILPGVIAKQGHMKLLAVRETNQGYEGGIADLYLEIKPGHGRVFLETFPLTKTDTQMSTRFAKTIACDYVERDCDDIDFFYTITADSTIIAGPSAGASIAILTIALLEDLKLNENHIISGTINSGGLIGPVGGLKVKIEAAKKFGLKKVYIPAGENIEKMDNTTINQTDLKKLSKDFGIEIEEISTLNEAIKGFTGREKEQQIKNIEVDEEYSNTMKSLAKELCDRSNKLKTELTKSNYLNLNFSSLNISSLKINAQNLTSKGREAFEKKTFYSAASYCFGSNVEYSTLAFLLKNLSKKESIKEIEKLFKEINSFRNRVNNIQKKTITDLEAYIVVKERLADAEESTNQALAILNQTEKSESIVRLLAYSLERINSANSWSKFLGKNGKKFNLNNDVLKKACQNKISEADERRQYVELYFPGTLGNVQKQISKANEELANGNYELCLSIASKSKADVDVILSVFGVSTDQFRDIVERKLEIVKNNLAKESSKGTFPILGYSYYEYANSLKENDLNSALLYSEYALELSNLDLYFKNVNGKKRALDYETKDQGKYTNLFNGFNGFNRFIISPGALSLVFLSIFITGILTGIVFVSLIKKINKIDVKKTKAKAKKNRKL